MYLYHAVNLQAVADKLSQDDDEFLQLEELTLAEVQAQIAAGTICDAKTLMAIMIWQAMQ